MRFQGPCGFVLAMRAEEAVFDTVTVALDAELVPDEPGDDRRSADRLARLGDHLLDRLGVVLHEGLLEERLLLEELAHAALRDLLADVLGLLRFLRVVRELL